MSLLHPLAALVRPAGRKRGEFTYGIRKEDLEKFTPDNCVKLYPSTQMTAILEELDLYLVGSRRSLNDAIEFLRQFIPYTLLWRMDETVGIQFAVYLRNKKNGEVKLATKLSLGAGGHVESLDAQNYDDEEGNITSEISVKRTLECAREREEFEEVAVNSSFHPNQIPLGFVSDSKEEKGYVGNTHVGLIVASNVTAGGDFDMKEDLNDRIGWYTPEELMLARDGGNDLPPFEPWSQLIIDEIATLSAVVMNERDEYLERIKARHAELMEVDPTVG